MLERRVRMVWSIPSYSQSLRTEHGDGDWASGTMLNPLRL